MFSIFTSGNPGSNTQQPVSDNLLHTRGEFQPTCRQREHTTPSRIGVNECRRPIVGSNKHLLVSSTALVNTKISARISEGSLRMVEYWVFFLLYESTAGLEMSYQVDESINFIVGRYRQFLRWRGVTCELIT